MNKKSKKKVISREILEEIHFYIILGKMSKKLINYVLDLCTNVSNKHFQSQSDKRYFINNILSNNRLSTLIENSHIDNESKEYFLAEILSPDVKIKFINEFIKTQASNKTNEQIGDKKYIEKLKLFLDVISRKIIIPNYFFGIRSLVNLILNKNEKDYKENLFDILNQFYDVLSKDDMSVSNNTSKFSSKKSSSSSLVDNDSKSNNKSSNSLNNINLNKKKSSKNIVFDNNISLGLNKNYKHKKFNIITYLIIISKIGPIFDEKNKDNMDLNIKQFNNYEFNNGYAIKNYFPIYENDQVNSKLFPSLFSFAVSHKLKDDFNCLERINENYIKEESTDSNDYFNKLMEDFVNDNSNGETIKEIREYIINEQFYKGKDYYYFASDTYYYLKIIYIYNKFYFPDSKIFLNFFGSIPLLPKKASILKIFYIEDPAIRKKFTDFFEKLKYRNNLQTDLRLSNANVSLEIIIRFLRIRLKLAELEKIIKSNKKEISNYYKEKQNIKIVKLAEQITDFKDNYKLEFIYSLKNFDINNKNYSLAITYLTQFFTEFNIEDFYDFIDILIKTLVESLTKYDKETFKNYNILEGVVQFIINKYIETAKTSNEIYLYIEPNIEQIAQLVIELNHNNNFDTFISAILYQLRPLSINAVDFNYSFILNNEYQNKNYKNILYQQFTKSINNNFKFNLCIYFLSQRFKKIMRNILVYKRLFFDNLSTNKEKNIMMVLKILNLSKLFNHIEKNNISDYDKFPFNSVFIIFSSLFFNDRKCPHGIRSSYYSIKEEISSIEEDFKSIEEAITYVSDIYKPHIYFDSVNLNEEFKINVEGQVPFLVIFKIKFNMSKIEPKKIISNGNCYKLKALVISNDNIEGNLNVDTVGESNKIIFYEYYNKMFIFFDNNKFEFLNSDEKLISYINRNKKMFNTNNVYGVYNLGINLKYNSFRECILREIDYGKIDKKFYKNFYTFLETNGNVLEEKNVACWKIDANPTESDKFDIYISEEYHFRAKSFIRYLNKMKI